MLTRRSLLTAAAAAAPLAAQEGSGTQKRTLHIVCRYPFDAGEVQQIMEAAHGVEIDFKFARTAEDLQKYGPEADIFIGEPRARDLDYMPRVKWVQTMAAGMEWMDDTLRNSKLTVTNMKRVFAPGIAETAMGLLLSLTRRIGTDFVPQFLRHEWKPIGDVRSHDYMELTGRTMGIVGMGGIGSELGRRAHYGFGMRVVATDLMPVPKPDFVSELHDPSWFREMAANVDVLVSAAPHTKLTERMFNEDVFKSMKRTAYFLAMSRGKLFDDMALVKALKEGWIAGAGMDVFPIEPPPPSHPIFDCKNVVMTPHTSGWGPEREVRLMALITENVRRYAMGAPLLNVVNLQAGF